MAARSLPKFPWGPVRAVGVVVLLHFVLVLSRVGNLSGGGDLLRDGALLSGSTLEEPWRLVTSLVLHVDLRHAFWNGVSMMVFAVPLITYLGYGRTALIYLCSGIGGGLAAVASTTEGTFILGSSGAVAGLFGAWVVMHLRSARFAPISWRARVRAAGIGLLVLPSLLNPMTPAGKPISVSAHLGGLATGMLIGAILSGSLLPRDEFPPEDEDHDDDDEERYRYAVN
jgi:rhomboid protease GluP